MPSWGALSVESLVLLRHDVEMLKSRGRREFATMVGLQFHHLQYDLKPQIQAALEDATSAPMGDFGKEASRKGLQNNVQRAHPEEEMVDRKRWVRHR